MESFVARGGHFPVAVLAANRPDSLQATLENFLGHVSTDTQGGGMIKKGEGGGGLVGRHTQGGHEEKGGGGCLGALDWASPSPSCSAHASCGHGPCCLSLLPRRFQVRGARREDVLVFQDGTNTEVAAVAERLLGRRPAQNTGHSQDALHSGANHGVEGAKVPRGCFFALQAPAPPQSFFFLLLLILLAPTVIGKRRPPGWLSGHCRVVQVRARGRLQRAARRPCRHRRRGRLSLLARLSRLLRGEKEAQGPQGLKR